MAIHRIKTNTLPALLEKPGKHPDGGGLYLQVASTCSASWVYQFSLRRKTRWMSLGPAATFTLAQARAAHHEARCLRDRGIDPIEARGGARVIHGPARVAGETFGEVALWSTSPSVQSLGVGVTGLTGAKPESGSAD